jgi:hypothetical protein
MKPAAELAVRADQPTRLAQPERLMRLIDAANLATALADGMTVTDALARRDMLRKRHRIRHGPMRLRRGRGAHADHRWPVTLTVWTQPQWRSVAIRTRCGRWWTRTAARSKPLPHGIAVLASGCSAR